MSEENKRKLALEAMVRINDRCTVFHSRIEDLMFRAQRIAGAIKANRPQSDRDFDSDLKIFRSDLKKYRVELDEALALVLVLQAEDIRALNARCGSLHGRLDGLAELIALAHQRMPRPDSRLEAWYCLREVNEMTDCLLQKGAPLLRKSNP